MKKIMVVFLFVFTNLFLNGRPAEFVPEGASWRIDINPHHGGCTMDWYETGRYYDEEGNPIWGQGQCGLPGASCHCYDWITWWFGIVWVPTPPEGWESIYGTGEIPTYNPITGRYEFE